MLKQLIFCSLALIPLAAYAQVPTEQDCLGAIPVCQETYYQQNSYSGTGNYPNEIPTGGGCPGNCLLVGERNDVWYIFTVQTSGDLGFNLTPNNYTDDYDWAVYSLNDYKCQDIYLHADEMQVSCNYSSADGVTGPNGLSNEDCQNASGSPHNALIPVSAGDTYVINISNYSSTQFGYELDFTVSTAEIYDDVPPELDQVETEGVECGVDQITFDFTEKVLCNTVQPSDFQLDGPGGPFEITEVFGEACDVGGEMEKTFTLTFSPAIYQSGEFTLDIMPLSFIQDNCGNNAFPQTLEFELELASFLVDAGEDQEIPFLTTTQLDSDVEGGSGDYTYSWTPPEKLVDPGIEDPITIPLSETTLFVLEVTDNANSCVSTDEVLVNVVGGEMSVTVGGDPQEICAGESTALSALASGGSGNYTYHWSSEPSGFDSDIPNPTAFPDVTTVYQVEVSDGYSTINGEVTIVVHPVPLADAGPAQEINLGTATQLDGSGSGGTPPYAFSWEPSVMIDGPSNIADPMTVALSAPQHYTLLIVDDRNCASELSEVLINIVGENLSAFPKASPNEICLGGMATLSANATGGGGNYSYTWTSSAAGWSASGDNILVSPEETTTYFVEVSDGFSTFKTHVVLPVLPLPEIDLLPPGYTQLGEDTIIACVYDTIILDAGNPANPPGTEFLWSNNWAGRYQTAKTNGNWMEVQTHAVQVRNPVTTCSNSGRITVYFLFNACAIGIEEQLPARSQIRVHPNPSGGLINLSGEQATEKLDWKVISLHGSVLEQGSVTGLTTSSWSKSLDISHLNKGVYLLWINDGSSFSVLRLVIQ